VSYRTVFAWVTAGVALWCTQGDLTIVQGPSGVVRVAMLPGWPQLAGSVILGLAAGIGLSLQRSRRESTESDPFLPLFALGVLILPYVPWVPDFIPALRLFAGPGRYFVWMIVISQMMWAFLGMGRFRRVVTGMRTWTPRRGVFIVTLISAAIFSVAAVAVSPSGIHPSGEEPHFLMLAQSVWRDGDLHIENNRAERGQPEYVESDLLPAHVKTGRSGQTASVLPVALPALVAPFYAAAGYGGVVSLLLALASIAAGLMWQWVRSLTGSVSAASFAWAATALSLPFAFNAPGVLPGIPAALCLIAALALGPGSMSLVADSTRRRGVDTSSAWRNAATGILAGVVLWLSPKYSLMSVALVLVGLWRTWRQRMPSASAKLGLTAWMLLPYGVACASWLAVNTAVWGSLWPPLAGGDTPGAPLGVWVWVAGAVGLVVDQEYGVVAYAPALLLGLTGLVAMLRAGGRARLLAAELVMVCGSLVAWSAAQRAWWGDGLTPGRQMTAILLLLAPPIAWRFREAAAAPSQRAVHRMLLLFGLAVSVAALVTQNGALLTSRNDGISRLIEYFSPDWNLWAFVPDLVGQPLRLSLVQMVIWGIAAAACCGLLRLAGRRRDPDPARSRTRRGAAFLRASAAVLLTLVVVTTVTPAIVGARLRPDPAPESRPRVGLIDTFDPDARPLAVRFDPLSRIGAEEVPELVGFSATPGSRLARQPMRLLLNARFILPAGRYVVHLEALGSGPSAGSLSGTLALQFGRIGPPVAEWPVSGASWEQAFDLPVDATFVGFKASPELESSVGFLRVRPARVTPMLDRIATSEVLAAAAYGPIVVLFHDDAAYVERDGFWLRGKASSQVSIVSPTGPLAGDVTLRIRPGPIDNTIVIEGAGGTKRVSVEAERPTEVRLSPAPLDGILRLSLFPERGWVPAERDPTSGDRRMLGCWIDVPR
jgi:hypothetical protein